MLSAVTSLRPTLALLLVAVTPAAAAQTSPAPWATGTTTAPPPPPPRPLSGPSPSWPTITPAPPPPAAPRPRVRAPREPYDAAADHYFQLPTGRMMRLGDLQGHYIGHLGWVGVRYGLSRVVDVGVGLPYYFAGISADARVAIVQRPGFAAAWWGYVSVPFKPDGESASSQLGFTWAYAGMGWLTGPLVSMWSHRFGVHIGAHVAQRTGLGGLWFVGHVTLDLRLTDSLKLIAQGIAFYEVALESADGARALLGNGTARFMPYALAGVRFHTRRFAADVGALAPLSAQAPLHSESLVVLPWMSLSHLF
jgi:hypothetical protein